LFADVCYVCKDDGEDTEMLVCDKCDYNTAHLECLSMKRVPKGVWHCYQCEEKGRKTKPVKRRRRRRFKEKKYDENGNVIKRKRRRYRRKKKS
jgi:hypothetical protein